MSASPLSFRHNLFLIASVIITKVLVAIALYPRLDISDYQFYFEAITNITHELLPWANNIPIYYPPLALIPMFISYFGVVVTGNFMGFVVSMWLINGICDIVTVFCIYWIGTKLCGERAAFFAAMLYATGISIAYFSLTKFDSVPTCLAMLAILFAVESKEAKAYLTTVIGLFTKIWPILLFPFIWIYKGARVSIITLTIVVASLAAFLVMILAGYNKFLGYTEVVYCNTIPYLTGQFIPSAGLENIITFFHVLSALVIIGTLTWFYRSDRSTRNLLKACLLAIVAVVFLMQYRSPQYTVWFMPFAALLVADRVYGIILFVVVQIFGIIEFPFAFYAIYTNTNYVSGYAVPFFIILFAGYLALTLTALDQKGSVVYEST